MCLLAAACGASADVQPTFPSAYPAPAKELDLPPPRDAVLAFIAQFSDKVQDRDVGTIRRTKGVAVATRLAIEELPIEGPTGTSRLRVGAVEPLRYRPVAPPSTRDAPFVWSSMIGGHGILTHEAAKRLGGESTPRVVEVPEWGELRIGAYADNGAPNLADLLVDARLARDIGVRPARMVVVGTKPGASIAQVGEALDRRLAGTGLTRLIPQIPEIFSADDPAPSGTAQGGLIGTMRFEILDNGFIKPDPAWATANIVDTEVPILGEVTCHRLMVPQMRAALTDIEEAGLAHLIDPSDYGGCYVPRFIGRDPTRALSMHAFGLAFDLNVQSNWLGTEGTLDPRIVTILERWGFAWGGRWEEPPDPMHFELERLLQG